MNRINDIKYKVLDMPLKINIEDFSGYNNNGNWVGTELYKSNFKNQSCVYLNGSSSITHNSVATNTISYWIDETFYTIVGSTYYTNGEVSSSFTNRSTSTTIGSGVTGKMFDVKHFNITLTGDEVLELYKLSKKQNLDLGIKKTSLTIIDDSLVIEVISNKDISGNETPITYTKADIFYDKILFNDGGMSFNLSNITAYEYWFSDENKWNYWFYDGTNTYKNGVLEGTLPFTISTTGFSNVEGNVRHLKIYGTKNE